MTKYNIDQLIETTLGPSGETEQHSLTLLALALTLRARNILELGVGYNGWSTRALLKAAQILDGVVTSVDIVDTGFRPEPELMPHWQFMQQDAIEFLTKNRQKYDLIMVDDWHAGDHVYKELKLIEPFTTRDTMILMHDLMHGFNQPSYNTGLTADAQFALQGPYGGLQSFIAEHPEFEYCTIPVSHGLTLLRKAK